MNVGPPTMAEAKGEALRNPQKFLTLDTKLLAALTKLAKDELARQILNFKKVESKSERAGALGVSKYLPL